LDDVAVAGHVITRRAGTETDASPTHASARVRLTPVAWLAHVELTAREWREVGGRLGLTCRSSNWWIGDWVRHGMRVYGEKYAIAARVTGYDVQTLMNMVYVANRFEVSRRRENLSWSHHAACARLDAPAQELWLGRSQEHGLSVRALRAALKAAGQANDPRARRADVEGAASEIRPQASSASVTVTCPRCGFDLRPTSMQVFKELPVV
jgi:hypothetical protein